MRKQCLIVYCLESTHRTGMYGESGALWDSCFKQEISQFVSEEWATVHSSLFIVFSVRLFLRGTAFWEHCLPVCFKWTKWWNQLNCLLKNAHCEWKSFTWNTASCQNHSSTVNIFSPFKRKMSHPNLKSWTIPCEINTRFLSQNRALHVIVIAAHDYFCPPPLGLCRSFCSDDEERGSLTLCS